MLFTFNQVKYGQILDIPSLTVPDSRIVCIFGESGSGKTTLLKLLNNLISCDQGEVLYRGISLPKLNPVDIRRRICMLPQTPVIFEGSIRDNLLIGLRFTGQADASDDQLHSVLTLMKLNKNLANDPKNLSGGEKQRLALARLLLLNPEVLLLDEPSSALDSDTEDMIIQRLVAWTKQRNIPVIMVTHSPKLVKHYAEHTIKLESGRLVQGGVA